MSDVYSRWQQRSESEKFIRCHVPDVEPWHIWIATSRPVQMFYTISNTVHGREPGCWPVCWRMLRDIFRDGETHGRGNDAI